jgi:hypothetical protein
MPGSCGTFYGTVMDKTDSQTRDELLIKNSARRHVCRIRNVCSSSLLGIVERIGEMSEVSTPYRIPDKKTISEPPKSRISTVGRCGSIVERQKSAIINWEIDFLFSSKWVCNR